MTYNHQVYRLGHCNSLDNLKRRSIAWLFGKVFKTGFLEDDAEPMHEDERDILLLGGRAWQERQP